MISKGKRIYSIIKMKCPQCHEGDFFKSKPYDIKNAGKIYESCSKCGLKYEKEPGFYYGAMYVSYGLQVIVFIFFYTLFSLFFPNFSIGWQIVIIILASLIVSPYVYALSKIIWINLFISYGKEKRGIRS